MNTELFEINKKLGLQENSSLLETIEKLSMVNGFTTEPTNILDRAIELLQLPTNYLIEYDTIFNNLIGYFPYASSPEDVINRLYETIMKRSYTFKDGNVTDPNWSMKECLTVAFEGIDATGKQTLSMMLKNFLEFTSCLSTIARYDFYSMLSPNQQFIKINIPNYGSVSGRRIKTYLMEGNYDPKLLQLEFAINRKEVQNLLEDYNQMTLKMNCGIETTKVCIFDRWVDSGVAFKLAKVLITKARTNGYPSIETILDPNALEIFLNSSKGNALWKEYIVGQEEIEYNTLGLVKPNFKVLCMAPSNVISERLVQRAIASGVPLDEHEKDLEFLEVVQSIYGINFADKYNKENQRYLILDTSKESKEVCVTEILHKLITNLKPVEEIYGSDSSNIFNEQFSTLCTLSEQINDL